LRDSDLEDDARAAGRIILIYIIRIAKINSIPEGIEILIFVEGSSANTKSNRLKYQNCNYHYELNLPKEVTKIALTLNNPSYISLRFEARTYNRPSCSGRGVTGLLGHPYLPINKP